MSGNHLRCLREVVVKRRGNSPAGRDIRGRARRDEDVRLVLCSNDHTDPAGLAAIHAAVGAARSVDVVSGSPGLREDVYTHLWARGVNATRDVRDYPEDA